MTISRVAHGTVSKVASGDLSPGAPAGSVSGNCWLCLISQAGGGPPTMSGAWTQIYSLVQTDGFACGAVFSHPYTGTPPSLTVTNTSGDGAIAAIVAYGSDVGGVLVDVAGTPTENSGASTLNYPTVTPGQANDMCVFIWHTGSAGAGTNGAITGTDPTPAEQLDDNTTLGSDCGLGYADGIRTAATATGARTSTYSLAPNGQVAGTVLLKESGGSPPPSIQRRTVMAPQQRMG